MKLHKDPLGLEEIVAEIISGSPRGAILISTSLIDTLLAGTIREKMVKLSKADEEDIFYGGNAPLSSFSSRIKVAFALGVFGNKMRHDLDSLRSIRNQFAHTVERMDLETHAAKLRGLHALTADHAGMTAHQMLAEATQRLALYLIFKIGSPEKHGIPPGTELQRMFRNLD